MNINNHNDSLSSLLSDKQKDYIFCLSVFFLYCTIYGLISFRLGYVMEEVHEGVTVHHELYIANMRWGVALWRSIFGFGALPLVAGLVAGAAISLSLLLHVRIFNINSYKKRLAYGCIYLCGIQWLYQLMYSNQSDVVALGFLLSSGSVYLMIKNRGWVSGLIASLLVALSAACYQSMLLYIFVLWGGYYIMLILNGSIMSAKNVFRALLVVLAGTVLWFVVGRVLMCSPLVSSPILESIVQYQGDFVKWSRLDGLPPELQVRCLARYMFTVPFSNMLGLSHQGQWIYAASLVPVALIVYSVWKQGTKKLAFIVGGMLLFLLYVPFLIGVVFVCKMPDRVNIAEPLAAACVWALLICRTKCWHPRMVKCFIAFLSVAVLSAIYAVGAYARTEAYNYERATMELISMHSRGMEVARTAGLKNFNIIIVGEPSFAESAESLFYMNADSLYPESVHPHIFRGGRSWLPSYIRYLRLNYMRVENVADRERYGEVIKEMPTWPALGSVEEYDGNIIVKVGP